MMSYTEDTTYHCRLCEPDYFPPRYPMNEQHFWAGEPIDRKSKVFREDGTQDMLCYEVLAGEHGVSYECQPRDEHGLFPLPFFCPIHEDEPLLRRVDGPFRVELWAPEGTRLYSAEVLEKGIPG